MKKILLMACALGMTMSLSAQDQTYRKSWDFTKWSAETATNLKTHADWTDDEKGDGSSNVTGDKCLWQNNALATAVDENGYLLANGSVIEETKGLVFTVLSAKSAAIALEYGTTTDSNKWGPYKGDQYFWPAGNNSKITFTIPGVEKGITIKMGVESHKPSDGRGVDLYVGTKQLSLVSGQSSCRPTTYDEFEWEVPEDLESEEELVTVEVRPSNGCHIYYITVGDGDGEVVRRAKKVAYITADENEPLTTCFDAASVELNAINPDVVITTDSLMTYEAVVVSPSVAKDAAIVPVIKSLIAYMPILNLNAELYPVWGLGEVAESQATGVTLDAKFAEDEMFKAIEGAELIMGGTLNTITLGKYFANDEVIATIDGKVAIHRHNASRNAYVNLPFNATCAPAPDYASFFTELAYSVADTKRNVSAAAKPTFTVTNENLYSEVVINAPADDAVVYYTIDGTEPTEASKIYEGETLKFTAETTVKAIATRDGYKNSEVAEEVVKIFSKVKSPKIEIVQDDASSTVTLSTETPDATIYYSFQSFTDTVRAAVYNNPIVLSKDPTYIYAMAVAKDCVNSDMSSEYVAIKSLNANTIRQDTVSHFSAKKAAWTPTDDSLKPEGYEYSSNVNYYFGKNAVWTDGVKKVFSPVEGNGTENDWQVVSEGQAIQLQDKDAPVTGVGRANDQEGVGKGYYADTAEDLIGGLGSAGYVMFGSNQKITGEEVKDTTTVERTAALQSVKAFKAPFDVVIYSGSNSKSNNSKWAELQISTDGQNWQYVDSIESSAARRYIKRARVSIDEPGEYYVRVTKGSQSFTIFDLYILNNGEVSQKYNAEDYFSAVEEILGDAVEAEVVRTEIYNINGMLMPELTNGINIVRTYYSDGTVKTAKVAVRK